MLIRKFRSLLFRHGEIHREIESEQQRPQPDTIRLLKLKRLRLALKDEMRKLDYALARRDHARLMPVVAARRNTTTRPMMESRP